MYPEARNTPLLLTILQPPLLPIVFFKFYAYHLFIAFVWLAGMQGEVNKRLIKFHLNVNVLFTVICRLAMTRPHIVTNKVHKEHRSSAHIKFKAFHRSCNHQKWLLYQIIVGNTVKSVQIDPQTMEIWTQ